jgi:hypothetical protein
MYRPTYAIAAFMGREDQELSKRILAVLLEALVQIDVIELVTYPFIPPLYDAGVRYFREQRKDVDDDWQDVVTTWVKHLGDCEELAAWRAAELRVRYGIFAWLDFTFEFLPDGSKRIHIFVRREDGVVEDPSLILMQVPGVVTVPANGNSQPRGRPVLIRRAA